MATVVRAEISGKNRYWIDKHRHYELKHFCLQYPSWKKAYTAYNDSLSSSQITGLPSGTDICDPTGKVATLKRYYAERIELIERVAMETDEYLYPYILKAVTEELSYPYLKGVLNIPCGRDMYYNRYRKFFWLLSQERR